MNFPENKPILSFQVGSVEIYPGRVHFPVSCRVDYESLPLEKLEELVGALSAPAMLFRIQEGMQCANCPVSAFREKGQKTC